MRPVLVIAGLNGHPGMLMRAAPQMLPGYRPIAFSHHDDMALGGVEGLADRAFLLLDREAPDQRVVVCGESFGGTVALTMAHTRPERVEALILLSAFGRHPSQIARHGVGAMAAWGVKNFGSRVGGATYRAGRLVSVPSQLGLNPSVDLLRSYLRRPRAYVPAYREKVDLSLAFDARPWLASVTCPTFVLVGTWDPVVAPSAGRELARLLPHATLHTLSGGHLVHLVQAERVGRLIADWTARDLR